MKRILFIRSSLFADQSTSNQLGDEFVRELVARNPGSTVTTLDLAGAPLPHLDADEFLSWQVDPAERSDSQQALAGVSDRLIDQLFAHDTLVLAIPMYNMLLFKFPRIFCGYDSVFASAEPIKYKMPIIVRCYFFISLK